MRERVTAPDGTQWQVRASRLPWRPRRRRIGGADPVGLALFALSLPLLAAEWLAAGALALARPRRAVVATAAGRRLTWRLDSPAEARATAAVVCAALASGQAIPSGADAQVTED